MAVVSPITENQQQLRPVSREKVQAADFGAAGETIGAAVAQAGRAGTAAADTLHQLDVEHTETAVRDADNQATLERQRLYYEGEGAFFNLQGRNALNALETLQPERDRIDREAAARAGSSPLAQRLYRDVAARRRIADDQRIQQHLSTQRNAWQDGVDVDGMRVAVDVAQNAYANPAEVLRGITTARGIAERSALRNGSAAAGSPEMENRQRRAAGLVVTAVANRIERESPGEALAFVTTMEGQIDGDTYVRLRDALEEPAAVEEADENVAEDIVYAGDAAPPAAEGAAPGAASDATPPRPANGAAGVIGARLRAGGLPEQVVAGFLGNLQHENGFRSRGSGDGGTAHGVAQWRAERVANFRRIIGVHPSRASADQSARFILWEMENPAQAGMTVAQRNQIRAARTPEEAARLIDQFYERSDGRSRDARAQTAREFHGGRSRQNIVESGVEIDMPATIERINARTDLTFTQKQARIAAAGRRHSADRQARAEVEETVRDEAAAAMNALGDGYTNYNQLPLAVRQRLSRFPRIEADLRGAAETNRRAAESDRENRFSPRYFDLLEMANGDPAQRELFMRQDVRTMPDITNAERAALINRQGEFRRSGERADTRNTRADMGQIRRLVNSVAGTGVGIVSGRNPNPVAQRESNENRIMLGEQVRIQVEAAQQRKGSPLTDPEVMEIIARETQEVTVVRQGRVWGESRERVPAYRSRAEAREDPARYVRTEREDLLPDGVPQAEGQQIVDAWRRTHGGQWPTREDVLRLYQARRRR